MKNNKRSKNRVVAKKGSAAFDIKKLIIYTFALLIVIAIYIYLANMQQDRPTLTESSRSEPAFRKDGELQFRNQEGDILSTIEIEIVESGVARAQGLMFRRSMAMNRGMLFVFDFSHNVEMWMRNTYIPLDMIFVREDKTIAFIETYTVPLSEETIYCPEPVKYVIEVNAGFTGRYGIRNGQQVDW